MSTNTGVGVNDGLRTASGTAEHCLKVSLYVGLHQLSRRVANDIYHYTIHQGVT